MPSIYVEDADLDLFYENSGPRAGPVVLLLHGWPDDGQGKSNEAADAAHDLACGGKF